jgi:2-dehydro-3-deoxygluconokinase
LEGASWFHFTGITPALSDGLASICRTACEKAREKGITVSCDINYRKNLWSSEKAGQVMGGLMCFADVCIANEEDADKVFGIKAADTDVVNGKNQQERISDRVPGAHAAFRLPQSGDYPAREHLGQRQHLGGSPI